MWWGTGSEPPGSGGEDSKELPQNQQLLDLQEQFEQQQTFIAQLKEMLRKTEQSSSVSREKVEEYATTLNEINARAKLSKLKRSEGKKHDPDESGSSKSTSSKKSSVVTPAKEKIILLRQQLEENRAKMAQRDKNQKNIEEMVNQLKAQLDDSQNMLNETQLNIPPVEKVVVTPNFTMESSKDDLLIAIKCKDDHITELNEKTQKLQANVLDLQENIKEKDSVIDARTRAITLLSENLSKKGKNTLDMLDETKEQMRAMQQNFVTLESKMKKEYEQLQTELLIKERRIEELLETNTILERKYSDSQSVNEELEERSTNLTSELEKFKLEYSKSEDKLQELTQINEELQNKLSENEKAEQKDVGSPLKSSKRSKSGKKSKPKETAETPTPESLHLNRIAELEKIIDELKSENTSKQSDASEIDDITKLNKQLEEMNKNMIKMKAQHKAKLKELQKKSSPNELSEKVSNLGSENEKLGQRVAELEVEKENLQLRLVDYESNKEITSSNEISSLRSELAKLIHLENVQVCSEMTSVELEEQLDREVSQKKEVQDQYNAIVKENESLLEKIEVINKEKQELSSKLENYMQENIDLIDRLEKLSTEKVSSAESIEIVEFLTQQEKLEIEAYQKNLEFIPDSDKQSGENIELEQSPDLNESVSKLTEETSELMERIELFTVERREVMDKMDSLTAENHQLLSKLEKFESEKFNLEQKYENVCAERETLRRQIDQLLSDNDKLTEKVNSLSEGANDEQSFEKLQEEITEYRALLENQKLQISSLQEELWNKGDSEMEISAIEMNEERNKLQKLNETLHEQLRTLQSEHETLVSIHQNMKVDVEKYSEKMLENDIKDKELINVTNKITELESKLLENVEEINFLQSSIEDNKTELIKASETIAEYDKSISMKNAEIEILKAEAEELQESVSQLNIELEQTEMNKQDTVTTLSLQLEELKIIITENFEQLQQYEAEMNRNSKTVNELNDQLEDLNYKIVETEHVIELKNAEIHTLRSEKSSFETEIKNLEDELKQKNDTFSETCRQLKEKCKFLENQIEANAGSIDDIKGPFEAKVAELEKKNRDQVEKMKKIAANLKKKTLICQDFETKLSELKEKWENESKEKDEKQKIIDEQNTEIEQLYKNYELVNTEKNSKLQEFNVMHEETIKLRKDLNESLTFHEVLHANIQEKENHIEKLNNELMMIKSESTTSSKEIIQSLTNQIEEISLNFETTRNAMEAKLQEKDMFIENVETESNKYKERVFKLEEGLSNIEERRQLLEERAQDLSVQLEAKSFACEEASQSEDFLEQRLSTLIAHDEIIAKKFQQSTLENQILTDKVKVLLEENDSLKLKLNDTTSRLQEYSEKNEKFDLLENECARLVNIIHNAENEMKKMHLEYERKLSDKNSEIENMEAELNTQLQELHSERKNALNQCEVLQDNIKEYIENEQLLNEEIEKLKQDLCNGKQQLEVNLSENQQLSVTNANSLFRIEQLENQLLSNVQNDTQTELDRLQKMIAQKDIDIQNYQRQNMQLQMATNSNSTSTASLFDTSSTENESLKKSLSASNARCTDLEHRMSVIAEELNIARIELTNSLEKLTELQQLHQNSVMEADMHKITVSNLQQEIASQNASLVRLTAEDGISEIITTAEKTVSDKAALQPVAEEIFQKQEQLELSAEQLSEDVSKEELLRKIKALEFMLFNVEREKDDTLAQCHEFTNELTRLVYERESLIKSKPEIEADRSEPDMHSLEEQIMSCANISDGTENLQSLEYSPVHVQINKDVCENIILQPIVEEVIQPKTAYLCYDDDKKDPGWGTEDSKIKESIESQIVQMDEIKISPEDKKEFQLLEYGHVNMHKDITDHTVAVNESIPAPKSAYLCYPTENKNVLGEDTFASEEDGWGWNAEEAKLEAEHRQTLATVAPQQSSVVDSRLEQLEERVRDLELERSRLLEEIKTSQIRSGKLIKKLKLMKEKNDSLVVEANKKSADFYGLDLAIQDELNAQKKSLEKKLKELLDESSKEKAERENLLKRVDVLTAGNERMIELKEKTDNEIQFLQFKNRELSSKLEQLEWGDDSPGKTKTPTSLEPTLRIESEADLIEFKRQCEELNNKIAELNSIVNDLTLDNEEMQCMLEEQRNMRIQAEKALLNIPMPENMKTEQEFLKVESENKNLLDELRKLSEVKLVLEEKITQYVHNNDELISTSNHLQLNIENLIQENKIMNNEHTIKLEQLQNENIELQNKLSTQLSDKETLIKNHIEISQNEILHLKQEIANLEDTKQSTANLISEKDSIIETLNLTVHKLEAEKTSLESRLQEILVIHNTDKTNDEKLQQVNKQLMASLSELESKNRELVELNNSLNNEKLESEQKISQTIEQLAQDWSERVDQRGNDVAESWKLHLESVENEFSQKEGKLKLELNEIIRKNEEIFLQNNKLQNEVEQLMNEKQAVVSGNNNVIESLQRTVNDQKAEITSLLQKLHSTSAQLEAKNNEIITLQHSYEIMQQTKDAELKETTEKLNSQIAECKDLEEKINELNISIQEEENQLSELTKLIETQVLKIEDLRTQLADKTDAHATVLAEFNKFESNYLKNNEKIIDAPIEFFTTEAEVLNPGKQNTIIEVDTTYAPISRAELDLTLYMLHQRDVRCEELNIELMHLLEERDTLQLKLSNALRQNENLRKKIPNEQAIDIKDSPIDVKSTGAIPKTRTEFATEATENIDVDDHVDIDEPELANKLSQLKSSRYRDKTVRDDQEYRYVQQMSLMQDHRDLASKLPAEAAARLLDASYTVSRDVQSPSKVLLNWLWGRSTPKVNDI